MTGTDRPQSLQHVYRAEFDRDVAYLIAALQDPSVRATAAKSLGRLAEAGNAGGDRAVPGLVPLLSAADDHARAFAAEALGKFRASDAREAVAAVARHDQVWWVRSWAVAALGRIGGQFALADLSAFLGDADYRIRRAAVVGLGYLGDKDALPLIKLAKRREPWHRRSPYRKAVRAIKKAHGTRPTM
jgi:HEAT repeat protein